LAEPVIVAPAVLRPLAEPLLPAGCDVRWFTSAAQAVELAPEADIGWFDQFSFADSMDAVRAATRAKWINTILVGLSTIPIDLVRERGVIVTNGRGLNSANVADYAVLGILSLAKGLADVVRAHDLQEWLAAAPGTGELEGSWALIIGYGTIGQAIGARLRASGVEVTGVRRSADSAAGILGAADWRAALPNYDWIILAAPDTDSTRAMIGSAELAACKPGARIVNMARGQLIDQCALIAALESGHLGGAFLDVTTPEPLPPEDPLWQARNCVISMHLSGRSQTSMFLRGAARFADNLVRYRNGEPLEGLVDLSKGY
jgi:phosphoglycerate dehydrogenase-like enzyme